MYTSLHGSEACRAVSVGTSGAHELFSSWNDCCVMTLVVSLLTQPVSARRHATAVLSISFSSSPCYSGAEHWLEQVQEARVEFLARVSSTSGRGGCFCANRASPVGRGESVPRVGRSLASAKLVAPDRGCGGCEGSRLRVAVRRGICCHVLAFKQCLYFVLV